MHATEIHRLKARVAALETYRTEAQRILAAQQEAIETLRAGLTTHATESARQHEVNA